MSELNRREFVIAATAAAACACAACDALAAGPTTAPSGSKQVDVGKLEDFKKDGITDKFSKTERILVIRSEGKLYAPTSTCTHKNCAIKAKEGELVCPCHGSKYTLMGVPTKGPAKYPLYRYGISKDENGHVIVDKTKQFEEKKWDDEGAFISVT